MVNSKNGITSLYGEVISTLESVTERTTLDRIDVLAIIGLESKIVVHVDETFSSRENYEESEKFTIVSYHSYGEVDLSDENHCMFYGVPIEELFILPQQ